MATGPVLLPIVAGHGDPTAPPGFSFNADGIGYAVFDDAAEEIMRWSFALPGDYASAPVLKGAFKMEAANTGTKGVVLGGRLQAITPDASESFATGGYSTQVKDRVPIDNDAEEEVSFSLTLNDDGAAAGDNVIVEFSRVGDDTTTETDGDDAVGDMGLVALRLEYTTS